MMPKKIHFLQLNNYMSKDEKEKKASPKDKEHPAIDPIIAKVIRDAISVRLSQINSDKRRQQIDELDAMVATCQEFMQSFIILGYDLNHQPIQPVVCAHNQQEADALGAYLSKFIKNNVEETDTSGE